MIRSILIVLLATLGAGCAHRPAPMPVAERTADDRIASFSNGGSSGVPQQWQPLIIHRTKKQTRYQMVSDQGQKVLHARAVAASSGLMQKVDIDVEHQPWLNWRWRVNNLIRTADNHDRASEDSPVRIVLGFAGDKDSLPFADQILFETARVMTGHELPYATLMYIWENKAPVGTVIHSSRSGRVRMMVVASGEGGLGKWGEFSRDVVADYEKAFGEKPGRLIGVGVLTDTDNTGETVEAWYGDLSLKSRVR